MQQFYALLQVVNCHDSAIYILAPLGYVTIYGCSDATIVLGAAGKVSFFPFPRKRKKDEYYIAEVYNHCWFFPFWILEVK